MSNQEKEVKPRMHPRNKNSGRYDFEKLMIAFPELTPFVRPNAYQTLSIDFADPKAVKTLNKALLAFHYDIQHWDVPAGYLCPPIPGRADYIHHVADLLDKSNFGKIPTGSRIRCLDIGVGANCIYPIIGNNDYGWSFIGSDTDKIALESANHIINSNPSLIGNVHCRFQPNSNTFFTDILSAKDIIDLTVCNPPFHSSAKEAQNSSQRKVSNLTKKKISKPILNFGGQSNELWIEGGEERFISNMIKESKTLGKRCFWFTTLVSKHSNLKGFYRILKEMDAVKVETIRMGQGNKSSRILAWTFLSKKEQQKWVSERWRGARVETEEEVD